MALLALSVCLYRRQTRTSRPKDQRQADTRRVVIRTLYLVFKEPAGPRFVRATPSPSLSFGEPYELNPATVPRQQLFSPYSDAGPNLDSFPPVVMVRRTRPDAASRARCLLDVRSIGQDLLGPGSATSKPSESTLPCQPASRSRQSPPAVTRRPGTNNLDQ
jgi:hypothetical protein